MSYQVELLQRGRDRVARGWCQISAAEDERGNQVDPESPLACRWCLYGAVYGFSAQVWDALKRATGSEQPIGWSDTKGRTQAEVVAAFDRAIASERLRP